MKSNQSKLLVTFALLSTLVSGPLCQSLHAAEPKRVIVVTVTTGFRHSSIASAEKTLTKLADTSKAFTIVDFVQQPKTVVPRKPAPPRPLPENASEAQQKRFEADTLKYREALAKWTPEVEAEAKRLQDEFQSELSQRLQKLAPAALESAKIDGVIFANTTGDLPLPDKEGFVRWVESGHALMAMHSASDTLHGFRPYIELLGGEFLTHGAQASTSLTPLDPAHPAAGGLQQPWNITQEELYHFKSYDRSRVRDILAADRVPMDNRPEQGQAGHFPVSWVRTQGTGKVFYTSLGHREDIWDDDANLADRKNSPEISKQFQSHILGGIRWALGLAEGSAAPQAAR
ncbi:MAG: hypothetical protein RLZZ142_741 [Verrucomicrobiota bacterium]|jgi:type 1 glutamine amidotransferase